ncbi:tannase/feruloyl esterase family alpha/beta hydrolase [Rhodovastum atsumiense]|uniref:Tannase/feruloyl esterase family alpha/beta hydrolase n=1 Tax=Rhodovastum atsumiense TaxID=504468 RepID=A0A5M6J0T6_9PROT|nr:tannase/feruloyl esterase family alpha/beta hydrolase [Rhodovastum atsumiense]
MPASGDLPAYCRVLGYVRPAINFELRLPIEGWNGKFYMVGCGAFCGMLESDRPGFTNAMNFGLRRRYAAATMDSGHWGANSGDGRWAFANPVAEADWAWRAVTETARVGRAMVKAYYGTEQKHAYFAGCSTGGRMAGVEASRFPADFDGIVMGAPALDYTGLVATFFAWLVQANTGEDGKPIVTSERVPLIQRLVAQACHAQDGLVEDPHACNVKPATFQCKAAGGHDCLSTAEVGVLEKWYAGPKDSQGRQLYPGGLPPGSEANWPIWLTGRPPANAVIPFFVRDFLRYMAFEPDPGPGYEVTQFDFDRDPPRLARMAALYNAATWDPARGEVVPADLSAFARRGGKLVIWHGWGDPIVTPDFTIAWYEALARKAGGIEKLQGFARLFMIPGMDHCGISADNASVTETGIDPLSALEAWVEQGTPPHALLATKRRPDGGTQWQRRICAWPDKSCAAP